VGNRRSRSSSRVGTPTASSLNAAVARPNVLGSVGAGSLSVAELQFSPSSPAVNAFGSHSSRLMAQLPLQLQASGQNPPDSSGRAWMGSAIAHSPDVGASDLEAVGSNAQSNLQSFSRPRIQFLIWSDGTAAASDVTETDKRMMCTLLVNAILSYVWRSLCADDLGK